MTIECGLSHKFSNMGIVAAFLVVVMHTGSAAGMSGKMFSAVFPAGLGAVAVPFFFLASGFFLARHLAESDWYGRELKKRVKSLVLPLLIWGALFSCFEICLTVIANFRAGRDVFANMPVGWEWLRVVGLYLFDYPLLRPLWFLRALVFLFVISPLLGRLVRKHGVLWLSLCFLASLFVETQIEIYSPVWHLLSTVVSLRGMFWFSFGVYLMTRDDHVEIKRTTIVVLRGNCKTSALTACPSA